MGKPASIVLSRAAAVAATILLCAQGWAQRAPIQRILITTVKPDRAADFVAAVKQYNEVYGKDGAASPRVEYQSMTGPNEFRLVRSYNNWAEMDAVPAANGNAELARITARINACVERSTTVIAEIVPDLTLPRAEKPPVLIRISRVRVQPEKVQQWMDVVKNEMLPAYKKAGLPFTVRRARMGAPSNEFYISTRAANWAEAGEGGTRKVMGEDAYQRATSKLIPMTSLLETNIYRYRPDMSYTGPAK